VPVIWCAISGHGYGHAAQTVPVLNELGRRISDLSVILRTMVPDSFFSPRLHIPWIRYPVDQGGGCVQRGPLSIDIPSTWFTYRVFHENWGERVKREVGAILSCSPDLILSNISYLALEAGGMANIPSLALASLTWDEVMAKYAEPGNDLHKSLLTQICQAYGWGKLVIRLTPGLGMSVFQKRVDVGPIGQPPLAPNQVLREKIAGKIGRPLVLVALGGVPLEDLPLASMHTMTDYQFLVDAPVSDPTGHIRSLGEVPATFDEIFAVSDVVLSKPGYATIIEAVASRKPVVYVRRYDFADEEAIVEYMHRYGRGCEMKKEDFISGNWQTAIEAVRQLNQPENAGPESGVRQAAEILGSYLS